MIVCTLIGIVSFPELAIYQHAVLSAQYYMINHSFDRKYVTSLVGSYSYVATKYVDIKTVVYAGTMLIV